MFVKSTSPEAGGGRRRARGGGYTLVEVLIAAGLLLAIVVGVMPLFSRSIQSNLIGGRASEMSAFLAEDIESVHQKIVSHEDWDLDATTCPDGEPCVQMQAQFWQVSRDADSRHVGDAHWVDLEGIDWRKGFGPSIYVWRRDATVRKYSYDDILPGNIDITGTTLTPKGHPELFDSPIANDDGTNATTAHVIEVRVAIQFNESEVLDDSTRAMTTGHFRAF